MLIICIFVASDFHCYNYCLKQDLSGFSVLLQIFFDVAPLPYILVWFYPLTLFLGDVWTHAWKTSTTAKSWSRNSLSERSSRRAFGHQGCIRRSAYSCTYVSLLMETEYPETSHVCFVVCCNFVYMLREKPGS